MAFPFLKLRPKAQTPARSAAPSARPSAPPLPRVMIGAVGAPVPQMAQIGARQQQVFKQMRRPPTHTELRIIDTTMVWLSSLPRGVRPLQCCKAFPHVVNRLAGWWDSPEALASYFDDLLNSRRGRRAGFPSPVRQEILSLLAYARASSLVSK